MIVKIKCYLLGVSFNNAAVPLHVAFPLSLPLAILLEHCY